MLDFDQHISFKYFLKIAFVRDITKIGEIGAQLPPPPPPHFLKWNIPKHECFEVGGSRILIAGEWSRLK